MKDYVKPFASEVDEIYMEPVAASSGDIEIPAKTKCSNGRREFNPGADKCQRCNGQNYNVPGLYCKEGMPRK